MISQHPQFWRNVWLSCKKVFVKVAEQRNKPCHNRRRILKNSKLNCFYRRVLQIINRRFRNGKYALIFILELYKCMLFKTIDRFLARQIRKYNMFPVTFQNSKSNIFFVIVLNSKYNGYVRYINVSIKMTWVNVQFHNQLDTPLYPFWNPSNSCKLSQISNSV